MAAVLELRRAKGITAGGMAEILALRKMKAAASRRRRERAVARASVAKVLIPDTALEVSNG
jgi:hypothetical protein